MLLRNPVLIASIMWKFAINAAPHIRAPGSSPILIEINDGLGGSGPASASDPGSISQ